MVTYRKELNLIRKNLIWFDCIDDRNEKCKLRIDDSTNELELGKHEISVEDISLHSNFGIDIRYKAVKIEENVFFKPNDYIYENIRVMKDCLKLGGILDRAHEVWVFPDYKSKQVEELEYLYNDDESLFMLEAKEDIKCAGCLEWLGYSVASYVEENKDMEEGINIHMTLGTHFHFISGNIKLTDVVTREFLIEKGTKFKIYAPTRFVEENMEEATEFFNVKKEVVNV